MTFAQGLESLVAMVKRDERTRSPLEAKRELTDAYLYLMLAIGFARLGEPDRASERAGARSRRGARTATRQAS